MKREKHTHQKGKTKFVRIDPRTIVEVPLTVPDNVVRDKFKKNIMRSQPVARLSPVESVTDKLSGGPGKQ